MLVTLQDGRSYVVRFTHLKSKVADGFWERATKCQVNHLVLADEKSSSLLERHDYQPTKVKYPPSGFWKKLFTRRGVEGTKTWSKVVGTGVAMCHPNDNFSREVGRKRSLTRALKEASFTKDERRAFWTTYLGRLQPPVPETTVQNTWSPTDGNG